MQPRHDASPWCTLTRVVTTTGSGSLVTNKNNQPRRNQGEITMSVTISVAISVLWLKSIPRDDLDFSAKLTFFFNLASSPEEAHSHSQAL